MKAIVWSKTDCPYCTAATTLLKQRGYEIEERKLGFGFNREQLFEAVPNAKTVPQIFIDEKYVGSYHSLVKYLNDKDEEAKQNELAK